jgi:hypothetical protein
MPAPEFAVFNRSDILDRHDSRQFGLSSRFARGAEPLTRRSEPGEPAAAIDQTDVQVAKAYDMAAVRP